MHRLARAVRSFGQDARGSVLVLAAGGIVAMTGLAALSIDTGTVFNARRQMQNAADAAALAGSQQLPANTSAASTDAASWASKNNAGGAGVEGVTFGTTYVANDTITVNVMRDQSLVFGPVFGKDAAEVRATAKAIVGSVAGANNLVPWGLLPDHNPCFSGGQPIFGASCLMKMGSSSKGKSGSTSGDFGALTLDGGGGDEYRENIVDGTETTYRVGDRVPTETGNLEGPTLQGITDRLASEPTPGCGNGSGQDTFSEVFTLGPGGYSQLNCPNSPRVIVVPVIDKLDNPNLSTITDFALMYLEDYNFNGGHSEVRAKLVKVNITDPSVIFGGFRNNGLRLIRLYE